MIRHLYSMPMWKRLIVVLIAALAFAGLFDALSNLPIVSGCTFYGECPQDLPSDPPSER